MKLSVVPKQLFFDRPKMTKLMDRLTFRTLGRFGSYTRRSIRNDLKKKKGPSRPGRPPHSHVGLLKKLTFFFVDPKRRDVSIGPTGFGTNPAVPGLLERGGMFVLKGKDGKRRRARIEARPFVNPAGERSVRQMPRFVNQAKRDVKLGP